jgi:hypothetical protein
MSYQKNVYLCGLILNKKMTATHNNIAARKKEISTFIESESLLHAICVSVIYPPPCHFGSLSDILAVQ